MTLEGAVPGYALCVIRNAVIDEIAYHGARCCRGGPIDAETVWEAASLTKPVVATRVLELAAAGELDVDAPLDVDLEAVGVAPDPRWASLTARHVLTHCSGLPNWRGPIEAMRASGWQVEGSDDPLRFDTAPGRFSYSGEAFEVLLHALGQRFGLGPTELLEPTLAELGMHDSSFTWRPAFDGKAAVPHRTPTQPLPKARPSVARAAGTLHTTLHDYTQFACAVLLADSDDVFVPAVRIDGGHGRSLGWGTITTNGTVVAWQHGDNPGFKHIVALRRPGRDGVIVFTNGEAGASVYREACRTTLGIEL